MAFKFSLQSLLRVRRSFEKRERLHLAVLTQELLKKQREIQELDSRISNCCRLAQANLAQGVISGEHQVSEKEIENLKSIRASVSGQLSEIERHKQAQQGRLIVARQNRRILESLHASRLETYRKTEDRREQQRQDDQFNSRRDRNAPPE
jgi:flagellar export protein FliJ